MVGDPYSHELTPELVRDGYAERIQKIPAAISNKKNLYFNGNERKPIDEIILIGAKNGAKKLKAFADHTRNTTTFLKWGWQKKLHPKRLGCSPGRFEQAKNRYRAKKEGIHPSRFEKVI